MLPISSTGCFQCCQSKRKGAKYELKCMLAQGRLVEAIFIVRCASITYQCSRHILEVKDVSRFADVISAVSENTAIFCMKDTLEGRTLTRDLLYKLLTQMEEFKLEFMGSGGQSQYGIEETPKRFRDIKTCLEIPPEASTAIRSYREANRLLHDSASLGCRLLVFKIEERLKETQNLVTLLKVARQDELRDFDTTEGMYGSTSDISSAFTVVKEKSSEYDHMTHTQIIEITSLWSDLKVRVTDSTFLAVYFGSADEHLDEIIPGYKGAAKSATNIRSLLPSSSCTESGKLLQSLSSSNNGLCINTAGFVAAIFPRDSSPCTKGDSLEASGQSKASAIKAKLLGSVSVAAARAAGGASKAAASAVSLATSSTAKAKSLAADASSRVASAPRIIMKSSYRPLDDEDKSSFSY
eukprot:CAMPEP_0185038898 /NCGR_PEP_ID=MMETSP1103-20130426/35147_1 /TAXON_ID=36769 /ORGANISM="Paraphysomonas bandaiensis, Strain Caron Lab Isolate" /LENGTH=409 /DNA_ID=CAMNT_0027577551 /DNA_START=498 /DNA_END=1727 /DNA_ORIENTATION=+